MGGPAGEGARRAEQTGGAGRGRAPVGGGRVRERRGRVAVPGAGARAPGRSQAREPASRRKWVPPSPPPAPPPAAASSPVTGASSAHVCETSPAGPGERDRPRRRDGITAAPALRRRGAGRGTGRGRKGQGERRVKGRPGARRGRPGRSGHAGAAAATARMRPGRGASPLAPHPQTAHAPAHTRLPAPPPRNTHPPPPPPAPLLPGVTDPKMCQAQSGRAPALRARLRDPRLPTGLRGWRGAITPTVPQFPPPRVPHSPVHYSLPHPLLHPGRDPFLRPRKRKLRVGGEGRVGVGKSAGKEGGAAKSFGVFDVVRAKAIPAAPRALRSPPTLWALGGAHKSNNKPLLEGQPPRPTMLGLALSRGSPQRAHHPAQCEPTSRLGWGRWEREGITGGPPPPPLPPRPSAGGCCSSPALLEGPCGVV